MRIILILLFLVALSFSVTWVMDHDAQLAFEWVGYYVETTISALLLVVLAVALGGATFFYVVMWLYNAPSRYRKALAERRREKGLVALTEGFAAIAAGDAKRAKGLTRTAQSYLGEMGLTRLLSAQASHLDGDREQERLQYSAMLEDKETEMIAIKGLLLAAREDGDLAQAVKLAEQAVETQKDANWALSMLLDLYKRTRQWKKALQVLDQLYRKKLVSKDHYRRTKAIMMLALGQELEQQGYVRQALSNYAFTTKEMPGFAPGALAYASLLVEDDQKKKALKVLESAWKKQAHPQLAEQYMQLLKSESVEKRLKQAERLHKLQPEAFAGHVLFAKAAIDAHELNKARSHLKIALAEAETVTICRLMAELESLENAGGDVVQRWRRRAEAGAPDDTWICRSCSHMTPVWHANCKGCQSFDSYEWASPEDTINVTPGLAALD